jgi:hypothetical protein
MLFLHIMRQRMLSWEQLEFWALICV